MNLRSDTAIIFALFGSDSHRLNLLHVVLKQLAFQSVVPEVFVGILDSAWARKAAKSLHCSGVFFIEGEDFLFQKEAIYNQVAKQLPQSIQRFIFLDADAFPVDRDWIERTLFALDSHGVVQGFSSVYYLSEEVTERLLRNPKQSHTHQTLIPEESKVQNGLVSHSRDSMNRLASHAYSGKGASGLCWAVRRDTFESVGGFPWQEVFSGHNCAWWIHRIGGYTPTRKWNLWRFADQAGIQRLLPVQPCHFVPRKLYHLFHRDGLSRGYLQRLRVGVELNFHPLEDLELTASGGIVLSKKGQRLAPALKLIHRLAVESDYTGVSS